MHVWNIVGGLFLVLAALVGTTIVLTGELSGLAVIAFVAIGALALGAQTLINLRLAKIDERTIIDALDAIPARP